MKEEKRLNEKDIINNLNNVFSLFRKCHISCWLTWGTLLGIYRDNKLIDDDIDIAVIYNKKNLEIFKEEAEKNGYKIVNQINSFKVIKDGFSIGCTEYILNKKDKILELKRRFILYPHNFFSRKIFFGLISKMSKSLLHYSIKNIYYNVLYFFLKMFGGFCITSIIPYDEVVPLNYFKYKDMAFYIPNNSETYLKRLYGKNWGTPIKNLGFLSKSNMHNFVGSFDKILVCCPKCKTKYVVDNPHCYKEAIEKFEFECKFCRYVWKEKVSIRGTVLKRI